MDHIVGKGDIQAAKVSLKGLKIVAAALDDIPGHFDLARYYYFGISSAHDLPQTLGHFDDSFNHLLRLSLELFHEFFMS